MREFYQSPTASTPQKMPAEIEFRALLALETKVRDYRNSKTYSSGGISANYAGALRALETALHNLKVFH